MIGGISPRGRYMYVDGGNAHTYINNYSGSQGVGNMRYNVGSQRTEVYDGNSWIQLNESIASVGLNAEAESLLDWARDKRNKELEIQALAKDSKAVQLAIERLKQAEEDLELLAILAKDYNEKTPT
jgi:hypothetical protein